MRYETIKTWLLIAVLAICGTASFSSCSNRDKTTITAEMAYEGVSNYCHSTYDWNVVNTDSVTMYVMMGEETESEYKVIFRSYTGAFVLFYVDKASGTTRMVEYVPALNVENEAGTIELFDYLEKKE